MISFNFEEKNHSIGNKKRIVPFVNTKHKLTMTYMDSLE